MANDITVTLASKHAAGQLNTMVLSRRGFRVAGRQVTGPADGWGTLADALDPDVRLTGLRQPALGIARTANAIDGRSHASIVSAIRLALSA